MSVLSRGVHRFVATLSAGLARVVGPRAGSGSNLGSTRITPGVDARQAAGRYGRGVSRLRALPGSLGNWLLAGALAAAGSAEAALRPELDPHLLTVPAAHLSGLALGLRRAAPLVAAATVTALLAAQSIAGIPVDEGLVILIDLGIAVFSVAAYLPTQKAIAGLALAIAAVWTSVVAGGTDTVAEDLVFSAIIVGTPWLAGRAYEGRQRRARDLEQRSEWLERAREADMRAAVAEERARIARELHDLISHTVSVMGVQAGAAAEVFDSDPARAREALRTIEQSARESVLELRRLLDVLRERGEAADLAPQPGLRELDVLAEQLRSVGLQVELRAEGSDTRLPPGLELAAYRIVQEALTNVVKHAQANSVVVTTRRNGRRLEIEVTDDGAGATRERNVGHGLIGMRERVALYGGSLEVGPRPRGGWRVLARLGGEGQA
jgi:signal transduction histidine kinase